jgi:YD repeat-containing protein
MNLLKKTSITAAATAAVFFLSGTAQGQVSIPTINGYPLMWNTSDGQVRSLDPKPACVHWLAYQLAAGGNSCQAQDLGLSRALLQLDGSSPYPSLYNKYNGYCDAVMTGGTCQWYDPNGNFVNVAVGEIMQNRSVITGSYVPVVDKYSRPPSRSCPAVGKPIHPIAGNEVYEETLGLSLADYKLTLTYDSLAGPSSSNLSASSSLPSTNGQLGQMWWSSFDRRLVLSGNGRSLQAVRGRGTVLSYESPTWVSSGVTLVPQGDQRDSLVHTAWATPGYPETASYLYRDQAEQALEKYNNSGQLQIIARANGLTLTPAHSDAATPASIAPGPGYLLSLADPFGRSIRFTYATLPSGAVVINKIIDALNQDIVISYDALDNLAALTWPDGHTKSFVYDSANASQHWALTGIVDENNKRYATVTYDPNGRAVATELAGGVNRYSVTYGSPPQEVVTTVFNGTLGGFYRYHEWASPGATSIVHPNGATVNVTAQSILVRDPVNSPNLGSPRAVGFSQPAGSGCAASSRSITFDVNGNRSSEDDFNGNRTCSVHDLSRNLETMRVEGVAGGSSGTNCAAVVPVNSPLPSGSRKFSTQWHPDWRMEIARAEPGRRVTQIFNGQADPLNGNAIASCAPSTALLPDGKPIAVLCKRVEQATADSDGHLGFSAAPLVGVPIRQTSWTYNQFGQVLTSKGPRTDVNDTTTYVYYSDTTADHTAGDLQSVTNPVGKSVTYGRYNKVGQVLESTDANGVVTTNAYDQRFRLVSASMAGETTTYSYDFAGQLTSATLPNGASLSYVYDDAHRLVQVSDVAGNRVAYTLDASGNRIAERVFDQGGTLVKNISRSFDALNRLQSVTGAPQ